MVHAVILEGGHVVSDDRARIDMDMVLTCLAGTYWGADRPRALLARSWANCLAFGVYTASGKQVGFARLLTDFALRAHLGDVFIQPGSRGLGLATALVETILSHPDLATVDHWTLSTADAHGLYARYGFRQDGTDRRWMTLDRSHEPGEAS